VHFLECAALVEFTPFSGQIVKELIAI
jgi:hypothetical protein